MVRFFDFLRLPIFPGSFKGHLIMRSANRRYTVTELLYYVNDNFDIPDDRVHSDIEGLDEEHFDEEMICSLPWLSLKMKMTKK